MKNIVFKWIKRIFILLCVIALLLVIAQGLVYNNINNLKDFFTKNAELSSVYYATQIIAIVAVVSGVIVAGWQYVLTARAERAKFENEKIQRAIELAKYYKDEVLSKYMFLLEVFTKSGIAKHLNEVDIDKMENFDIDELETVISKEKQNDIKKIIDSKDFLNIVLDVIQKRGYIGEESYIARDTYINKILEKRAKDKDYELTENEKGRIRLSFLNGIVSSTLNCLEYFSMNFTHNIANEKVVFTSLSQTYIPMVKILYYNIATNNHDASRYYTNVIWLFNVWKKRHVQKETKLKEMKRKCIEYGDSAKSV